MVEDAAERVEPQLMPAMLQLQLVLRLLANTTRLGEAEARRLWSTAHYDAEAERMQLQA